MYTMIDVCLDLSASVHVLRIQNQGLSPKGKGTFFYYLFMIAYLWRIPKNIGDFGQVLFFSNP